MKNAEFVSVIIPAYNAQKFIKKSLDSLIDQSYKRFEIIIIDDASTDAMKSRIDTISTANPTQKIRYYKNRSNMGASASRNRGAKLAKGSVLLFCDSDDEFERNHISTLMEQMQTNNLDAVSALTRHTINERSKTLHYKKSSYWGTTEYKLLILGLTGCDLLVKKSVFNRLRGFKESMRYAEDWDLQVRILQAGYGYGINDDATVRHREHDDSITSDFSWTEYRLKKLLPWLRKNKRTTNRQLAIFMFGTLLHSPLRTVVQQWRNVLSTDPLFLLRHPYHVQVGMSALLQRVRRKLPL